MKRSASARRKAGLADLKKAQAGVRYVGTEKFESAEQEERYIADLLYADKLAERNKRNT